MKQLIVKKWICGQFKEIGRYNIDDVMQIRHHTDGIQVIVNGAFHDFDTQCVLEFGY